MALTDYHGVIPVIKAVLASLLPFPEPAASRRIVPEDARIATGTAPPTGFRRVPLAACLMG